MSWLWAVFMWPNTQTARVKARQFEPRKNKTHTYSIWQTKLFLCHCSAKQSGDSFHSIGHVSRPRGLVPAILRSAEHPTDINMEETRHSNQPRSVSVCRSLLCININTSATLFPDQKFGLLFALENWMLFVDMKPRPILLYNRSPIFPVLAGSWAVITQCSQDR